MAVRGYVPYGSVHDHSAKSVNRSGSQPRLRDRRRRWFVRRHLQVDGSGESALVHPLAEGPITDLKLSLQG